MLVHREFDASEMSFGGYVAARSRGDSPFIAIPVFPSRFFRHSAIYVNAEAGIERPEDLKGKRVGVPEYQQTAAVWIRGILQDDHGVRPSDVRWFTGGQEHPGRREQSFASRLPEDVRVERIAEGKTLSAMLEAGEIDALFTPLMPEPIPQALAARAPPVSRLPRGGGQSTFAARHLSDHAHAGDSAGGRTNGTAGSRRACSKRSTRRSGVVSNRFTIRAPCSTACPGWSSDFETARELMGEDFWPYGLEAESEDARRLSSATHTSRASPRARWRSKSCSRPRRWTRSVG